MILTSALKLTNSLAIINDWKRQCTQFIRCNHLSMSEMKVGNWEGRETNNQSKHFGPWKKEEIIHFYWMSHFFSFSSYERRKDSSHRNMNK